MIVLTHALLRARISTIFERVIAAHGPVEEVLWDWLRCDGCGKVHNIAMYGTPPGWMTEGDFDEGFRDLCPDCYERENNDRRRAGHPRA